MYFGYFMMRRAIDEPHRRARMSAVLSVLASVDIVIVWKSIEWFRTQHPGPVLEIRGGGGMARRDGSAAVLERAGVSAARNGLDPGPHAAAIDSGRDRIAAALRTRVLGEANG